MNRLAAVLELGHPTALYQLPQVTENEMSPECVAHLAADYPNFYLLKDTSGADRVALAGLDLQGVFLVRGAEGQYHRWLGPAGGPYDGYLLSTANCFAQELAEVMELSISQIDDAAHLAQRVENAIECCFDIVRDFPAANPFANANKIIDQVMAFGDERLSATATLLIERRTAAAGVCPAGVAGAGAAAIAATARLCLIVEQVDPACRAGPWHGAGITVLHEKARRHTASDRVPNNGAALLRSNRRRLGTRPRSRSSVMVGGQLSQVVGQVVRS